MNMEQKIEYYSKLRLLPTYMKTNEGRKFEIGIGSIVFFNNLALGHLIFVSRGASQRFKSHAQTIVRRADRTRPITTNKYKTNKSLNPEDSEYLRVKQYIKHQSFCSAPISLLSYPNSVLT